MGGLPARGETRSADDASARRSRWLGLPPADEERVAAAEARLGRRLPPSYREFLMVSDGWRHAGGFVWLLAGTADARWHDDASGLADTFEEDLDEEAGPQERREAGIWRRGLQLDVASDATYVLMDPEDVDEDGEWAVYTWAGWRAAPPERHASFRAFMREMHREFHRLRACPGKESRSSSMTRRAGSTGSSRRPGWRRCGATGKEPCDSWTRPGRTADREPPDSATRYAVCSARPTWWTSAAWPRTRGTRPSCCPC